MVLLHLATNHRAASSLYMYPLVAKIPRGGTRSIGLVWLATVEALFPKLNPHLKN